MYIEQMQKSRAISQKQMVPLQSPNLSRLTKYSGMSFRVK